MAEIQNIIELTFTEADGSAFAASALESANNAAESATNAFRYANAASASAEESSESATQASNSASDAITAKTNAETAAQQAETSATNAATSETNASNSATSASESAATATTKASEASQSATAASNTLVSVINNKNQTQQYYIEAMSYADSAERYADNATNSAFQADQSAQAASASATNASTSANNAASSATTANSAADDATAAKTAAETAKTAAEQSATSAATSAQTAQDVLESIPSDYTTLTNDVSDSKNANSALTTLTNEDIPLRWEQGTLDSNNGSELSSTTKIRTQTIDISKYTSVTFNNTSGYKFRTAWLNSSGAVVKEAAYAAERTVTSVSYGFMSRYNITAVRVVLGKTSNADIVPSEGSALTMTGVMEIETKVDQINTTLSNDYKYADTDYKQVPLTSVEFAVGHLNDSGTPVAGYRPYTDFINLDNDMIIESGTYLAEAFVYNTDGTFVSRTGWSNQIFIPYTADRKIRLLFDKTGIPNNSTSPQINQIINSEFYIGVKRKKEYIEESVSDVLTNMTGQDGNTLNFAFITDLHVTAFEELPLRQVEVWNRNTNGLACVDESRNIDFVVLGGDYLWNDTSTTLVRAERAYKLLQECFYQFKDKQFALKGNHDDNSIANNVSYIVSDSERYGYLGQQYTNDVNIKYGNAEKSYGYIDFKRQKVRALFINTVDIPSYTGQHITGVSNTQLNFFADALNISESGWALVVFSHHVLVNNATMATDSEAYLTPAHGGDALWGMIQAFKNKTTYSKVSTLTDYEYSVDVDYSNNGSSEIIACINGHTHRDLSATQDGVLLISTTASGFEQTKYDSTGTQITQTLNTQTETSYDIYSFDRINRTIKASRYGAGQNRNWSY